MTTRQNVLISALLAGSMGLGACSEPTQQGDLQVASAPLFTGLREEYAERILAHRAKRDSGDDEFTCLPSEIVWAEDIYDAIERATIEDKPIFMLTFVRENGDPACDV